MKGDTLAPGRHKRHVSAGLQRNRTRNLGPRVIRYSVQMGKEPLDLADVISANIERWYDSAGDFARAVGMAESTVSRIVNRQVIPSAKMIERIAPHVYDNRKRAVPARTLIALAYPNLAAPGDSKAFMAAREIHPLAVELDKLIGESSPLDEQRRSNLVQLADSLIAPYRTALRKRKSV